MRDWLSLLPQIMFAQALGVGLAWGVDALSWKWRRDEGFVAAFNILAFWLLVPYVLPAISQVLSLRTLFMILAMLLFWLVIVAWMQTRQFGMTTQAAFWGAMMQLGCFIIVFGGGFFAYMLFYRSVNPWLWGVWFISMFLTYALLSLFRPTIYSTWSAWRQNSRKNRPLR